VLPFVLVFDGLGAPLEIGGYAITAAAAALGLVSWQYARVLLVVSVLLSMAVTFVAVLLSDVATRRYMRGRDLVPLLETIVLEHCGYRQVNSWWACIGTVQALSGKGGWGVMKRRSFE
jgi:branched-subunit amino acid ABC-type transport system permease component